MYSLYKCSSNYITSTTCIVYISVLLTTLLVLHVLPLFSSISCIFVNRVFLLVFSLYVQMYFYVRHVKDVEKKVLINRKHRTMLIIVVFFLLKSLLFYEKFQNLQIHTSIIIIIILRQNN